MTHALMPYTNARRRCWYCARLYFGDSSKPGSTSHDMRDFQRARVYRAEARVDRPMASMMELDALAATLRRDFDLPFDLRYEPGVTRAAACAPGEWIVLGDVRHTRFDLLHEFAHLVAERGHEGQAHGPLWAAAYLHLVLRYSGPLASGRLRAAMEFERVRWIQPGLLLEPLVPIRRR